MTNPASEPDRSQTTTSAGPRVYDTNSTATGSTSSGGSERKIGVYDTPARASGPPTAMIIAIIVLLAVVAFFVFRFVF